MSIYLKSDGIKTQLATRSGGFRDEYLSGPRHKEISRALFPETTDQDREIVMRGMILDINTIATMIVKINSENNKSRDKDGTKSKLPTPWWTDKGIAEIREIIFAFNVKRRVT